MNKVYCMLIHILAYSWSCLFSEWVLAQQVMDNSWPVIFKSTYI